MRGPSCSGGPRSAGSWWFKSSSGGPRFAGTWWFNSKATSALYRVGTQNVAQEIMGWKSRTGQCGLFGQLFHFLWDILHSHLVPSPLLELEQAPNDRDDDEAEEAEDEVKKWGGEVAVKFILVEGLCEEEEGIASARAHRQTWMYMYSSPEPLEDLIYTGQ